MTEQNQPDPTAVGKLAQQIVTILINESSASRQRAIQAAMMLLGETELISPNVRPNSTRSTQDTVNHANLASFFERGDDLKPSDYAHLCAAYHFSQYGATPFSVEELRAIAMDAGVVLPDRLDMTLRNAFKKGKKLYQAAGKGLFKPTATAGVEFGEKWNVRPGNAIKTLTVAE